MKLHLQSRKLALARQNRARNARAVVVVSLRLPIRFRGSNKDRNTGYSLYDRITLETSSKRGISSVRRCQTLCIPETIDNVECRFESNWIVDEIGRLCFFDGTSSYQLQLHRDSYLTLVPDAVSVRCLSIRSGQFGSRLTILTSYFECLRARTI